MDIEKLIETLRQREVAYVRAYGKHCSICNEVTIALSMLQAENEKLRAELEQVKWERDAAIKDIWVPYWISCKNGENCDFVSAITGMPDCVGCNDWEWRGPEKENQL